jgi:rhodanese-related sulfurtransferase
MIDVHSNVYPDGFVVNLHTLPQFEAEAQAARAAGRTLSVAAESLFTKQAPLVVGCASGVRSLRAAQLLREHGFTQVVEQRAGMDGVRDAFGRQKEKGHRPEGLPVATQAASGRSHAEIRTQLASPSLAGGH